MDNADLIACVGFGAGKPERIDLPKHRMFDPTRHLFSFGVMGDNALTRHHPRKRVIQYCRVLGISSTAVFTGYSPFAVYDGSLWRNSRTFKTKTAPCVSARVPDHAWT